MASHFSTIGLPLRSEEDFFALAEEVAGDSERIEVSDGAYLRWSSASGAELWLQIDGDNGLLGMNPHFVGESSTRVALTARLRRPGSTTLDGAFHGWADPQGGEVEGGAYPFVFDAPDFRRHDALTLPAAVEVQIAAFAHELSIFRSEREFRDSQTGEVKFATQSFIPSGLFTPGGADSGPPEARAIFTGRILRAETRWNESMNRPFHWALVETYGATFDVVIDPDLVEEEPTPGGVLSGSFWLSGTLLPC
jgi:hypothetical protein